MFRHFIGSSTGLLKIQTQELCALFMNYGITHAYRIKCRIMMYMSLLYSNYFGSLSIESINMFKNVMSTMV